MSVLNKSSFLGRRGYWVHKKCVQEPLQLHEFKNGWRHCIFCRKKYIRYRMLSLSYTFHITWDTCALVFSVTYSHHLKIATLGNFNTTCRILFCTGTCSYYNSNSEAFYKNPSSLLRARFGLFYYIVVLV